MRGENLLNIRCGGGLHAIVSAKCGAVVSASDSGPLAVQWAFKNAMESGASQRARCSPALKPREGKSSDVIACNGLATEQSGQRLLHETREDLLDRFEESRP